ncbi:MAG TPA: nitroreductase family protein [Steroidobacteraceae bacterium]|nr:nitroreductase family protein [Steroidobacteraceae bacterium]
MDLQQAIRSRRAVRVFSSEPVERATLLRLIDAAIQAPSAVNEQSWSFTVVEDRNLLTRISAESKACMLATAAGDIAAHHLEGHLRDPAFDIFYHAPALIVISSVRADRWAVENCSLAAENLMLAACAEGLGTCWIGFAQTWLASAPGKAALGIPAAYLPVAPIIVGHPQGAAPAVPRKAPEIHWIGAA